MTTIMLQMLWQSLALYRPSILRITSRMMSEEGSITDEGGKLAKKAAADERQYVRQLEEEQWKALRLHHQEEINGHLEDIKRHEAKIAEHQRRLDQIKGPHVK